MCKDINNSLSRFRPANISWEAWLSAVCLPMDSKTPSVAKAKILGPGSQSRQQLALINEPSHKHFPGGRNYSKDRTNILFPSAKLNENIKKSAKLNIIFFL